MHVDKNQDDYDTNNLHFDELVCFWVTLAALPYSYTLSPKLATVAD
jgi:hypothetical protein